MTKSIQEAGHDFTLFRDRLQFALDRANLNQSELGRAIGTTPQSVQNMVKRDKPDYRGGHAQKMADVLNVSVSWLAYNEGSPPEGAAVAKALEQPNPNPRVSNNATSAKALSMEGLSSLQTAGLEALAKLMREKLFGDAEVIDLLQQLKPQLAQLKAE